MISKLTGRVSLINISEDSIILETQSGIGYDVNYGNGCNKLVLNSNISIFTNVIIREDAHSIFGFESYEQLVWFKSLLKVSGIGPKLARAILDIASPDQLSMAILSKNPDIIGKVSGLGPKTLERLILELKNEPKKNAVILSGIISNDKKLDSNPQQSEHILEKSDAISALVNLGFSHTESANAVMSIDDANNLGETIQKALKLLKK